MEPVAIAAGLWVATGAEIYARCCAEEPVDVPERGAGRYAVVALLVALLPLMYPLLLVLSWLLYLMERRP